MVKVGVVLLLLFFGFIIYGFFGNRPIPVSRVKNDQRNLATGLESYFIDHKTYPPSTLAMQPVLPGSVSYTVSILPVLSTPVAYVTNAIIEDPLPRGWKPYNHVIRYVHLSPSDPVTAPLIIDSDIDAKEKDALFEQRFLLISSGPDRTYRIEEVAAAAGKQRPDASDLQAFLVELVRNPSIYDPSNGIKSKGDIIRTRKGILSPFLLNAESDPAAAQTGNPASASLQYDDLQATGSHPAVPGAGPPLP